MGRSVNIMFKNAALAAALFTLLFSGCNRPPESEKSAAEVSETPAGVAVVEGQGITLDDFKWYLATRSSGPDTKNYDEIARNRINELITVKALSQEARSRGLDQEPAIKFAMEQMLGRSLIDKQIITPVMQRVISRQEIQDYYQNHKELYSQPSQVRLADIFIAASETVPQEQLVEKAEALLLQARQAEGKRFGFSTLVRDHSDKHPVFPIGDTGYFDSTGQPIGLDEALVEAAFSLTETGKVHDELVVTSKGFHIIMLVGRRPAVEKDLESVAVEIEQRIRREEIARKREEFVRSLVAGQSIEIFDEKVIQAAEYARTNNEGTNGSAGKRAAGVFNPQAN